jgi:hypothetical protein
MLTDLMRYAQAIGQIESGGRYGSVGPSTKNGDRAYGKYQVMGNNIPQWTAQVLGRSMSPSEFLQNPQAQDAVFHSKFGDAVQKYGNPDDAASIWFSGRPLAQAGNASDGYNTVPQYLSKFHDALGDGSSPMAFAGQNDPTASKVNGIMASGMSGGSGAPAQGGGILSMLGLGGGAPSSPADTGLGSKLGLGQLGGVLGSLGAGMVTAANPAAGAALQNAKAMRALAMAPKLQQVGQDLFGRPQYAWVDSMHQSVTPMNVGGGAGGAGGGSGQGLDALGDQAFAKIDQLRQNGASQEEMIASLPREAQGIVKGMLEGKEMPGNLARSGSARTAFIALARAVDPTFDETNYQARLTQAKDLATNGRMGRTIKSANQLIGHLDSLDQATDDLHNTPYPKLNAILNYGAEQLGDQRFQAAQGNFNTYKDLVASEAVALMRQAGGAEQDVESWRKRLDSSKSPAELHSAVKAAIGGMRSAMSANVDQYNLVFHSNKAPEDFLSGSARSAISRIESGGKPSASAPSGSSAPSIKDGATATNPKNGHSITRKGGVWVDTVTGQPLQ